MRIRNVLLSAVLTAGLSAPAMADLTGKVTFAGKPPEAKQIDMSGVKECNDKHPDPVYEQTMVVGEKGELANVVVSIKKEDSPDLAGEPSKDAAVLDQKGCMYSPHVLAMCVGQPLVVKNDDEFLHNVHSLAQENPNFNFGQPNKDDGKTVDQAPKAKEYIRIKCDVHPWMSAYLAVFEHPFFAVSGEDGAYTIKGLPDGEYTVQFWHEKLATTPVEAKVTIKDGKGELNHEFKAEGAMAPDTSDVKLASLKTGDKSCCEMSKKVEKVAAAPAPAKPADPQAKAN
jgi:hypothetical protein